jgi:SAM-dependent methyltransferase
MPEFTSRDPRTPGFWDERFERAFTPWDLGGVPLALRGYVERDRTPRTVLIPGCGNGYELVCLSEAGWDATAIDFSPAAVSRAQALVGPWAPRVVQADFFDWQPQGALDLIYERAATCGRTTGAGWGAGRFLFLRHGAEGTAVRHRARRAGRLVDAPFRAGGRRRGRRFAAGLCRAGALDGVAADLSR